MLIASKERKILCQKINDLNALLSAARKPLCPLDPALISLPSYHVAPGVFDTLRNGWRALEDVLRSCSVPSPQVQLLGTTVSSTSLVLLRAGIAQRMIRSFTDSASGIQVWKVNAAVETIALYSSQVRRFAHLRSSLFLAPFLSLYDNNYRWNS